MGAGAFVQTLWFLGKGYMDPELKAVRGTIPTGPYIMLGAADAGSCSSITSPHRDL